MGLIFYITCVKNNKVIEILGTLDKKEFSNLKTFISSPYFNTNATLIKFYNILKKHYPSFNNKSLKKEIIFDRLYPGKIYNDGTFRNILSDMRKLLLKYLTLLNFEKDEYDKIYRLTIEADNRKLDSIYTETIKQYKTLLDSQDNSGYYIFNKARQYYELKANYGLKRGDQKSITGDILNRANYTIFEFIINLLNEYQNLKINKDAYNAEYIINLTEEIAKELNFESILISSEKTNPEFSEIFKLFVYEGLAFLNFNDDNYYFRFKSLFYKYFDKLSPVTKDNLFISLENICLEKIYDGNSKYIREAFTLSKERLLKNVYLDETNEFNIYLFRKIILNAVLSGEINWLEKFVKRYSGNLPGDFREEMKSFSNCIISFEKGKFEESLKYARSISDKAEILKLSLYSLKIKIYFELSELDALEYILDSFTHYITNNRLISEKFKEFNKNFIYASRILLKYLNGETDQIGIMKLKAFIEGKKYFKDKKWLLEKLANINK